MKNERVYVSLTGGLGNQLFQLARALAEKEATSVKILQSLGQPRRDNYGNLEIQGFDLPTHVEILSPVQTKPNLLIQKMAGYVLRMGISPRSYEKGLVRAAILYFSQFSLQLQLRLRVWLEIGDGVGYSPTTRSGPNTLLIGYFQSCVWAQKPDVYKMLQNLHPREESSGYSLIQKKSESERPIVVHVRLGDYLNEKDFGILSARYYEESIRELWESGEFGSIWAFSDEPEKARNLLPEDLLAKIYWVPQEGLTSVQVLQLMRLGHGYVIGNSTFSWWGAFLSYNEKAKVIAPDPWFLNLEDPKRLIPDDWKRIRAR
jgi:hypothetical protein